MCLVFCVSRSLCHCGKGKKIPDGIELYRVPNTASLYSTVIVIVVFFQLMVFLFAIVRNGIMKKRLGSDGRATDGSP